MKAFINSFRNLLSRNVIIALSCVLLIGISVVKIVSLQEPAQAKPVVEKLPDTLSLAPGFKFIDIKGSRSEGYQVVLKNEYDKSITAFEIGVDIDVAQSKMTRDLIHDKRHNSIPPGTTWTEFHPHTLYMDTKPLTIFGVIFEDGDGDGQTKTIKNIKEIRLGQKMQLKRFRPKLLNILQEPDWQLTEALDRLELEVSSLPASSSKGIPHNVAVGLLMEKIVLQDEIRRIKHAAREHSSSLREELIKFKETNELKAAGFTENITGPDLKINGFQNN
ncbi:MAG: hypothetical protein L0229_26180 [Blastocatellia bacterium]|nr:hypothetical protein [Blastocatellia bacterium]